MTLRGKDTTSPLVEKLYVQHVSERINKFFKPNAVSAARKNATTSTVPLGETFGGPWLKGLDSTRSRQNDSSRNVRMTFHFDIAVIKERGSGKGRAQYDGAAII